MNSNNNSDDKDNIGKIKSTVKSAIHTVVGEVNKGLAKIDEFKTKYVVPVQHQVQYLSQETTKITAKCIDFYNNDRYEYGPQIVIGTSFVLGTFNTLRRNRYTGLAYALLGGGISYAIIYENPFLEKKP